MLIPITANTVLFWKKVFYTGDTVDICTYRIAIMFQKKQCNSLDSKERKPREYCQAFYLFLAFGIHSSPLSSLLGTLHATCSDTFHKLLSILEHMAFENLEFSFLKRPNTDMLYFKLLICYLEMATPLILLEEEISIGNPNTFWKFRVEETYSGS